MAGVKNVLATSGTAFTEMQIRLLSRFTKRVVVNFDPDAAGATPPKNPSPCSPKRSSTSASSPSKAASTPTATSASTACRSTWPPSRGAKRHSDYLIDRARQQFPARTADAKVKAMNFPSAPHPPHAQPHPARRVRRRRRPEARHRLRPHAPGAKASRRAAPRKRPAVPPGAHQPRTEKILLRALVLPERRPRPPARFRTALHAPRVVRRTSRWPTSSSHSRRPRPRKTPSTPHQPTNPAPRWP